MLKTAGVVDYDVSKWLKRESQYKNLFLQPYKTGLMFTVFYNY